MSLSDLGLEDWVEEELTLLIDGDLIVYSGCCIFNADDSDTQKRLITKHIKKKVSDYCEAAGATSYIMFVTPKVNFRDFIVDDYKANRIGVERPVNLAWAKRWAVDNLNTHFEMGMEADDLLAMHQTNDTIIWSEDKDLRQVPGKHLDHNSQKVIEITPYGVLEDRGKKVYFTGAIGFLYQLLVGDGADYIVGCGHRATAVWKTGAKAGQEYIRRKGVGHKQACKALIGLELDAAQAVVEDFYELEFGDEWRERMEEQANLLFMVRYKQGDWIKRWTLDARDEYMNCLTGEICATID